MTKTIRSLALAVAGTLVLSACTALNALIPDQDVPGGVLGIGTAGVDVELTAAVGNGGIGAAQVGQTVFTGTLDLGTVDVEEIEELPNFVEADAITETVVLGDSIVVNYPTGGDVASFTLTELEVTGSVTIGSIEYALPVLVTADGLAVIFGDRTCDGNVCTYETASNLPEFDVALAAAAVGAYSDLLKAGGTVSAELVVTATLAAPGLTSDAEVVVTIASLGAVIEF